MLLDESQWRSNLIGDWSVPLIREETKWRYKLYKNWLNFLDEVRYNALSALIAINCHYYHYKYHFIIIIVITFILIVPIS